MKKALKKYLNYKNIEKNYYIGNYKVQILLGKTHNLQLKDVYCVYKNKKVLNNRYKEYNLSLHTF